MITWSKSIKTMIFNYMLYKLQEENCSLLVQIYHTIAQHTCSRVQLITVLHLENHWSWLIYNYPFFSFDSSVRRNEKKKENEERICGSQFFKFFISWKAMEILILTSFPKFITSKVVSKGNCLFSYLLEIYLTMFGNVKNNFS